MLSINNINLRPLSDTRHSLGWWLAASCSHQFRLGHPGRATSSSAGASTGRPSRFEMAESRNYHPQTGTNFSNALPLRIKAIEFERGYVINKKVYKKDSCNMYLYFFFSKTIITPKHGKALNGFEFLWHYFPKQSLFHHHHWGFYHHPRKYRKHPHLVWNLNASTSFNWTSLTFSSTKAVALSSNAQVIFPELVEASSHGYRIKVGVAGSSGRKRAWRFWTHIVKNQVAALCTVRNSRIQKKVQLVKEKLSNKVEPVRVTMANF